GSPARSLEAAVDARVPSLAARSGRAAAAELHAARARTRDRSRACRVDHRVVAPRAARGAVSARAVRALVARTHVHARDPSVLFSGGIAMLRYSFVLALFAGCSSNMPADADPFATFEDCYNDHHVTESFDAKTAIAV